MRRNKRDSGKLRVPAPAIFHCARKKARAVSRFPYIIGGIFAFLLLCISATGLFIEVKHAYAMSDCGILIACPSPTPRPTPSPTPRPTPSPTKKPTPTPTPRPTPTPTPRPTLTATATPTPSPTATLPVSTPTAATSPTSVPATTRGNTGQRTPGQPGGDMPVMAVVVAGISLCLLIGLAAGWLLFRRALLPTIEVKLPPSGARPWSRTRVPNPGSLGGIVNMQSGQATTNPTTAQHSNFAPGASGFGMPGSNFPLPGGPNASTQQVPGSTAYNNWPGASGYGGSSPNNFLPPPYPDQG